MIIMATTQEIKALIKELDIYQLQTLLSEYYSEAENKPASIYNAINKGYDELSYDLLSLVEAGEIDTIKIIVEIYS